VVLTYLNQYWRGFQGYFAGYIVKKIALKVCGMCFQLMKEDNSSKPEHLFITNKTYCSEAQLITPSTLMIDIFHQLETSYKSVCEEIFHKSCVRKTLVKLLHVSQTRRALPLCEDCIMHFTKLFVTIRIHHSLRLSSQTFQATNMKRNRKILKLSHL